MISTLPLLLLGKTGVWAVAVCLVLIGLTLLILNGRKLAKDWPRLKPVHNTDLAWVQIYLGLILLVVAWVIVANPAQKLTQSTTLYRAPDR